LVWPSDADPTRKLATAMPAVPKKRVVARRRAHVRCVRRACARAQAHLPVHCARCVAGGGGRWWPLA